MSTGSAPPAAVFLIKFRCLVWVQSCGTMATNLASGHFGVWLACARLPPDTDYRTALSCVSDPDPHDTPELKIEKN